MRRALPPGAQPKREPVTPEKRPPVTTGRVAMPARTGQPDRAQRAAAPGGRAVAPSPDAQPVTPTHPQRVAVEPTVRARDRHRLTLKVTR